MNIEVVGYMATAIIALSLTPQVYKSWKTKSTKDISIPWILVYITGLFLWIIYGVGIASNPLTLSATIEILVAISLLILKLKYK
ncbi:MAG: SemiSWEET family transporter [Candidatus Peribacteraceae bacterium]|jgi:MtN3 and saliva related transmembrane protein